MIIEEEEAYGIVERNRKGGFRIVVCCGVFDILHHVHCAHLTWAKGLADILFVIITPDRGVQKGTGRPYFKQAYRAEQVDALASVDYVILGREISPYRLLGQLEPEVYAKGKDVEGNPSPQFLQEMETVKKAGGVVRFGPEIPESHSSDFLKAKRLDG